MRPYRFERPQDTAQRMPDSAPAPFGSPSLRRPGIVRQGCAEPRPDETARASTEALATVPRLTVVVPTFNERGNVERMFAGIDRALTGVPYEVIFVDDDSPDGTADLARQLGEHDPRVRCIRRVGRRGLAGSIIGAVWNFAMTSLFVWGPSK